MKIHRLEVHNVKGLDNFVLDDIPDSGVVVIAGNNERGKSTVMQALELLLDGTKSSSSKMEIKELRQHHHPDEAPRMSAELTLGGTRLRVEKQFLSKNYMTLKLDTNPPVSLHGDEALSRLQKLLEENIDLDLYQALFVKQGELEHEVKVKSIKSISAILGGADEDSTDSSDDTLLMKARQELLNYRTNSGKDNKLLTSLRKAIEEDEAKLAELASQKRQWDDAARRAQDAEDLAGEASEQLEVARAELAELEKKDAQAAKLELELSKAKQAHEQAQHKCATAEAAVESYRAAEEAAAEAAEELAEFEAELAKKKQAVEEENARIEELATRKQKLKTDAAKADAQLKQLRAAEDSVAWALEAAAAADKAATIEKLLADERALKNEIADNPVTAALFDDAVNMWQRHQALTEAIAAASPELSLTAESTTTVEVDGERVELAAGEEPTTVDVVDPLTLKIGDVTATITPRDSSDRRAEKQLLEEELEALFSSAGVDSIDGLKDKHSQRLQAEQRLNKVESTREYAEGDDGGQPRARCEQLLRNIADLRVSPAEVREILEQYTDEAASVEEVLSRIVAAADSEPAWQEIVDTFDQSLRERAAEAQATLTTVIEAADADSARRAADLEAAVSEADQASASRSAQKAWDVAVGQKQGLERDVARTAVQLEALGDKTQLEEALASATVERDTAATELAKLQDQPLAREIDSIKLDIQAVTTQVKNIERRIEDSTRTRAQADGIMSTLNKVAADYDVVQQQRDSRVVELARIERAAAAAELLVRTLEDHLSLARTRYSKPFAEAVNRIAKQVFESGVELIIDNDTLEIISRRYDKGDAVEVKNLSAGAREQLALVNRCALASMVAEDGSPMPLLIDDPLGNSDRQRTRRMNQILSAVGENSQVLVFTCDPGRFDAVPGALQLDFEQLTTVS